VSVVLSTSSGLGAGDNRRALASDERRERLGHLALTMPGLIVVGVAALAPVLWLFWQSAFDKDGAFTLENYGRLFASPVVYASFLTTFELSFCTVLICAMLGIPLSVALATLQPRTANRVMIVVLLPLWTSLLVRTYAWLVILQRHGLINEGLTALGVIDAPLELVNNFTGVLIGMVHVMLPLFVLPTYGAMRDVDPNLMRAAASMGAGRWLAFRSVLLPLSLSGMLSGATVVFVFSLGFYVIPAVLGGGHVNPLSIRIDRTLSIFQDWGAASALGVLLVFVVGGLGLILAAVKRVARRADAGGGRHV
jgi:ABC-type spermidine/putrescine transport system permease subunit I